MLFSCRDTPQSKERGEQGLSCEGGDYATGRGYALKYEQLQEALARLEKVFGKKA